MCMGRGMNKIDVIVGLIKTVSNRDKFLKITQYYLKLRLLGPSGWTGKEAAGMKKLAATLSLARLVYRLGDWLDPLQELLEKDGTSLWDLHTLETMLSFLNAVVDDLLCLQKATGGFWPGLTGTEISHLDILSTKLWLSTICLNAFFLWKKMPPQVWKASTDQKLAMAKHLCDTTFCLYDINDWQLYRSVPIVSGILAASIGITRSIIKLK